MRRSLARLMLAGTCSIVAPAVHSADKPGQSPEQVANLVAQLGDRNFRTRQAAGKSLEEVGESALPALRTAAKDSDDEEVRRRAEVLCERIERSALLSPKRVTISMKGRSVEDVVAELARQTGYRLVYQGGQARKIDVDLHNVTYWEALERLCDNGHLSPGFDEQQGVVYLYQQNTVSPYTHHAGPFRIVAQNFSYNRHINLANLPRNGVDGNNFDNSNLTFGFLIQSEPKVPILMVGQPKLTKAEDENGFSLLPRQNGEGHVEAHYFDGGMYRNFQHSTGVAMSKPVKDSTRVKALRGKVPVLLLAGVRPDVVVDKLAPGKMKSTGVGRSAEIEVEEVTEANKNWTLTIVVKRHQKNGEAQDFNWMNTVQQKLELYDDKGRRFHCNGATNFINQSPNSVHAAYQFSPPGGAEMGPAVKLVLTEWLTAQHELEFEFKDLPLP